MVCHCPLPGLPVKSGVPSGLCVSCPILRICVDMCVLIHVAQILRCPSDETVKWQFYNSLKQVLLSAVLAEAVPCDFRAVPTQATFLRRGSVDAMMGLSKEVQTQLWLGLSSCTFCFPSFVVGECSSCVPSAVNQDMYTIAARALLPSSVGGALTGEDACVAVRVVRPGLPFLQRPVTAVNPAGILRSFPPLHPFACDPPCYRRCVEDCGRCAGGVAGCTDRNRPHAPCA